MERKRCLSTKVGEVQWNSRRQESRSGTHSPRGQLIWIAIAARKQRPSDQTGCEGLAEKRGV